MDWSKAVAPTNYALSSQELDAYLQRCGLDAGEVVCAASASPGDPALLRRVVEAQSLSIPFEMFDVTLGVPVDLTPSAIVEKLCRQGRGGYCLETNGLCAYALQALGFSVRLRHSRVWLRAEVYTPREPPMARQHQVLVVQTSDGVEWLVDVGLGGGGPCLPLPLVDGMVHEAAGDVFRNDRGVVADGEDSWILWVVHGGVWKRLHSFEHVDGDCPRVHATDFLMCSHFVQTARGTLFLNLRFATRPTREGRVTLMGRELKVKGAERLGETCPLTVTRLGSAEEYREALEAQLGLRLTLAQAQTLFDADS